MKENCGPYQYCIEHKAFRCSGCGDLIKTLYLAGPMRGLPRNNSLEFARWSAHLRSLGLSVWNPAENDVAPNGQEFTFDMAMAKDLPEVCKAGGVATIGVWEKSVGARLEVATALALGHPIFSASTLEDITEYAEQLLTGQEFRTEQKPTNPKDAISIDKLDISLYPQSAIVYGALAMTEGALKYGGYNYRPGGVNLSVYVGALLRHLFKFYNGQWADPKSKVPHIASVNACSAIIIDAHACGVLRDDRPPQCDLQKLITETEETLKHLKQTFANNPPRHTAL